MSSAKFGLISPSIYALQKGIDIVVSDEGYSITLNVFCDVSERDNPTIRVSVNGGADNLILVSVNADDFKEPGVSFSEDKSYCYVVFSNNGVHIKLEDEGVVLDVWDSSNDIDGAIDTNYIFFSEFSEYN